MHPDLVRVVERAIQITTQHFWVQEGLRTRGAADPFNGHIDEFRIAQVQRSDDWIETTWTNMSNPAAFTAAATEEQDGGEPPRLTGAGAVVCLMG